MEILCYEVILYYVVLSNIFLMNISAYQGDSCDWIGSGLRQPESFRGVQPVYLRCSQGHIEWHYPRGALRIVLRHGTSQRDFRGCIRIARKSRGARIYLEGHRKLFSLYSEKDERPVDLIRCFSSTNGQAALYVESEPNQNNLSKDVAQFFYDLQVMSRRSLMDDLQECHPCTEEEILQLYCTSDFVLGGTVSSLYHQHKLQRSELTVRIVHLIRDSHPSLFNLRHPESSSSSIDSAKYAVFHRPLKCGTKSGSGEYLFLGRWILGNPTVKCAPRYNHWKKIRRKALIDGANQCQM